MSTRLSSPMRKTLCLLLYVLVAALPVCLAQQAAPPAPSADTTVLDKDGTARITRVVPVPKSISPEAQAYLATGETWAPGPNTPLQQQEIERARALYPVNEESSTIAGVKVTIFTPKGGVPASKRDRVLINLHGGGFRVDSGSYLESIPIASLAQTKVVSVLYRLAPAVTFPAPVDDVIAVYKELLKSYKPQNMAIYGTSAGAVLTVQTAVRIRKEGLPQPAALGFFTGFADFSTPGDSRAFFGVPGLMGARIPEQGAIDTQYVKERDSKDPLASPIFSDLKGFPPTLCMTATRDVLMSGTVNFHRALFRAGVEAPLIVFDALPHAFWYMVEIPESKEAVQMQAKFFDEHLGKKGR